jgi:signal transduction histidine kinase
MVIQTVAAREVASTDRASARAALAAVQLAGREALLEMRRMIGVLRRGDVQLAGSATPGLDQLDLLAQRARMSGLPVELSVRGRRRALPEALDLVAFRIVQEALTNSIKHAGPARASVTVTFEADRVELEIYDDGRGASPDRPTGEGAGHGLVGMRERLALFDGELSTGGRPGGGFRVFARLPVEETLAA